MQFSSEHLWEFSQIIVSSWFSHSWHSPSRRAGAVTLDPEPSPLRRAKLTTSSASSRPPYRNRRPSPGTNLRATLWLLTVALICLVLVHHCPNYQIAQPFWRGATVLSQYFQMLLAQSSVCTHSRLILLALRSVCTLSQQTALNPKPLASTPIWRPQQPPPSPPLSLYTPAITMATERNQCTPTQQTFSHSYPQDLHHHRPLPLPALVTTATSQSRSTPRCTTVRVVYLTRLNNRTRTSGGRNLAKRSPSIVSLVWGPQPRAPTLTRSPTFTAGSASQALHHHPHLHHHPPLPQWPPLPPHHHRWPLPGPWPPGGPLLDASHQRSSMKTWGSFRILCCVWNGTLLPFKVHYYWSAPIGIYWDQSTHSLISQCYCILTLFIELVFTYRIIVFSYDVITFV